MYSELGGRRSSGLSSPAFQSLERKLNRLKVLQSQRDLVRPVGPVNGTGAQLLLEGTTPVYPARADQAGDLGQGSTTPTTLQPVESNFPEIGPSYLPQSWQEMQSDVWDLLEQSRREAGRRSSARPEAKKPSGKDYLGVAATGLPAWRKSVGYDIDRRCLQGIRYALGKAGLALPRSQVDYSGVYAISCGRTLAKNPGRWNWKRADFGADGNPPENSLVFFDGTNKSPAGHVAIYRNGKLYDNNGVMALSTGWKKRLAYAFVPDMNGKSKKTTSRRPRR